jgi:hypothetical protein
MKEAGGRRKEEGGRRKEEGEGGMGQEEGGGRRAYPNPTAACPTIN